MLGTAVPIMENFMGAPMVSRDIIVYLEPDFPDSGGVAGRHAYSYVRIYRAPGSPIQSGLLSLEEIVYHELGHHYLAGFSDWVEEGGAEFLTAYILNATGERSFAESKARMQGELSRSCYYNGIKNIMEHLYRESGFLARPCDYPLGLAFMLGMYEGLGKETVSASLRELSEYGGTRETREERVYEVFRSNTSPGSRAKFEDLYARLHGLPPPGWTPSGPVPSTPDARALMALYNATDGQNWIGNHYWGSELPIDRWRGVTTNANGRVVELRLPNSRLSGPIPPELGALTELEVLHLYDNELTGSVPPQLGNLSKLKRMALSGNNLRGSIPPELGRLTELIHLSLGNNQLSGSIPVELGNLNGLRTLLLQHNRLTGCIPNVLKNLPIANNYARELGLPFC